MTSAKGLTIVALSERRAFLEVPDGSYLLDPAVSADGRTYAFIRQPPAVRDPAGSLDFGSDLAMIDSDGRNERVVLRHATTGEFIRYPVFLPGGEAMLVGVRGQTATGFPDFRIERVELSSGIRSRLIEDATAPALAPDGRTLAYAAFDPETLAEHIASRDLVSSHQRLLVPRGGSLVLIQGLTWSPDGKTLAFMSSDLNSAQAPPAGVAAHPTLQDLWLVDADGGNLRRLVELVESAPSATWSADGNAIYVMAGGGFWRIDPRTGDRVLLGEGVFGGSIVRLP